MHVERVITKLVTIYSTELYVEYHTITFTNKKLLELKIV